MTLIQSKGEVMESAEAAIIDTRHPSLKDQIILLLGNNSPMTTKQVFYALVKEFEKNISYQGVHKMLAELSAKGIILKQEKKYSLNIDWVENSKTFLENIKHHETELQATTIVSNSFHDWGRTMLQILAQEADRGAITDAYAFLTHIWWILVLQKDEYRWFKKVGKTSFHGICKGNTLFDRCMATFYRLAGHKIKLGVNYESNCDLIVYGDKVYQIYFPQKLKKIVDKECSKLKDPSQLFKTTYKEIMYNNEMKTKTIIIQDKDLADRLRQDIKTYFEEDEK